MKSIVIVADPAIASGTHREVLAAVDRGDAKVVSSVDVDTPPYTREPKPWSATPPAASVPPPLPTRGPGTELKKLLATVGITATPDCSCNARARTMDERGCDWCEEHIDEIVGWLREEAGRRTLPFVDAAGRMLVRRAIRNARKAKPA